MNEKTKDCPVIVCRQLCKTYEENGYRLKVLDEVSFEIEAGEQVAIIGSSGSGKSTFLQLLAGLDKATSGTVLVQGRSIHQQKAAHLEQIWNQSLGFIYQAHHLLPELTALENVAMPLWIGCYQGFLDPKITQQSIQKRATELLEAVGLGQRLSHKPAQLSGGERQRVAIARALVQCPVCLLADEPTGNLDNETALQVFELMQALNRSHHTSLIVVTHDITLAQRCDRVLHLHNGQLSQYDI